MHIKLELDWFSFYILCNVFYSRARDSTVVTETAFCQSGHRSVVSLFDNVRLLNFSKSENSLFMGRTLPTGSDFVRPYRARSVVLD